MKRQTTLALIASLLTTTASAEGLTYARINAEHDWLKIDGTSNFATRYLEGAVEYEIGQFLVSGDLNYRYLTNYGASESNTFILNAGAGYRITPDILLGAGLTRTDATFLSAPLDGYEVFGQYQTVPYAVGLTIANDDTADDETTTSVYGAYTAAPGLDLGVVISKPTDQDSADYKLSVDYETGPFDLRATYEVDNFFENTIIGFRGHYKINDMFRLSATLQNRTDEDFLDLAAYTIGGGYKITEGLWVDALVGLRTIPNVPDTERIEISLRYELGEQARIDRRFQAADQADRRGGFAGSSL